MTKRVIEDKIEVTEDVSRSDTLEINGVEYCMRRTDCDEITLYEIGVN